MFDKLLSLFSELQTIEKKITEKDSSGNEISTVTIERPDGSVEVKKYENDEEQGPTQNLHNSIVRKLKLAPVLFLTYSIYDRQFNSPLFWGSNLILLHNYEG